MPNLKISQLPEVTVMATNDVIPVVVTATSTTSKITEANFHAGFLTATSVSVVTNKDLTDPSNSFPTSLVTLTG